MSNKVVIIPTNTPKVIISEVGTQGPPGRGIVSFERISGDGSPGSDDVYRLLYSDGTYEDVVIHQGADGDGSGGGGNPGNWQALQDHIYNATPHPAYDDMVDLTLIFQNGLI